MAVATFDTLEFVESLESAGFTKEQSKGMVGAFKKAQDSQLQELATKGDVLAIKGDISVLRGELRETEARLAGQLILVKWMLALVVAATVIPALKTLLG